MKKTLLIIGLIVSLFAAYRVSGQNEGRISYEIKVNMHRTLPPGREEMKNIVPEFNIHRDVLVFKGSESYYSPVEEEPQEDDMSDGQMHIRMKRPQAEYYSNNETGQKLTQRELFGKFYLIGDSVRIQPWKLSEETKAIMGYQCKSATFTDPARNQKVVAWYTEKIRPFLGPESFNTLPGTVLQIDINDGERVITAEKVEFISLKKGELRIPARGTRVTEGEFRKIMEETHKRMGAQGGIIIRTN